MAIPPAFPREFRGVWVATVANIDWPSKPGLSTATQQRELVTIFDKAKSLKLNAIIFQVRPTCDAFYPSKLEPWSVFLSGQPGVSPVPSWDPLEFAVAEAHKRGMELHAWFNPYRAWHPSAKADPSPDHISKKSPSIVKRYGEFLWLDPGEKETQEHSMDVIMDVVNRYDIDGVHLDDYFYPYPVRDASKQIIQFPDDATFAGYRSTGGVLSRDEWRRKNVDDFIQRLYESIKKAKRWVKFGISPFGIYRPGVPDGIVAGVDQYAELFADAQKWLNNAWCDYFTPQLYWPIQQKPQSYTALQDWWIQQNTKKRNLWPGNFTSQINSSNPAWSAKEIVDQIEATRKSKGATGNVHFSMKALQQNYKHIDEALLGGPYSDEALIPVSPWLGTKAPTRPRASIKFGILSLDFTGTEEPFSYAISVLDMGTWKHIVVGGNVKRVSLFELPISDVWVSAVGSTGFGSKPVKAELAP